MPTREYQCDECGHSFEDFFYPISADHPNKCPECGEVYGDLFRQVYQGGGGSCGVIYGSPSTFGQQAELNAKRMGKEQMQLMAEEAKARRKKGSRVINGVERKRDTTEAETPWWRTGEVAGLPAMEKQLDLRKISDPKKYIETGEK